MIRESQMTRLPNMNSPWSHEDHLIAFNLYCQLPFGKLHQRNADIVKLAGVLGRTPSSVAMKLSNFARLDPALQQRGISGLSRGAKGEEVVWREFASDPERLAYESQRLLAQRIGQSVESTAEIESRDLPPSGTEREAIVRLRVNQSFFRRRILSAYDYQCCVTGIAVRELLVASHIIPWAEDEANRLNPRNGLCLNALHDRAFDRRLMWIDEEMRVRFAPELASEAARKDAEGLAWLLQFE